MEKAEYHVIVTDGIPKIWATFQADEQSMSLANGLLDLVETLYPVEQRPFHKGEPGQ